MNLGRDVVVVNVFRIMTTILRKQLTALSERTVLSNGITYHRNRALAVGDLQARKLSRIQQNDR